MNKNLLNVIQEQELKLLMSEIPELRLNFEEIHMPPGELKDHFVSHDAGRPPEGVPVPKKFVGKLEQFFCIVERPGQWKRYLVTQKRELRVMTAYGCARLCKDLNINQLTLNLNNPLDWHTL